MFPIKIQNGSDIRRVTIQEDSSFLQLRDIARNVFVANVPESFVFKYKDNENEFITITNDFELSEAIRFSKTTGHSLKILITHPWIPTNLARSLPFQLDPAQLWKAYDSSIEYGKHGLDVLAEKVHGLRQRAGHCRGAWKKGVLALILFLWLCKGCSLIFMMLVGIIGYKVSSSYFGDRRGCNRRGANRADAPIPSAPPVDREEHVAQPAQPLYPRVDREEHVNQPSYPRVNEDRGARMFEEKLKQLEEMGFLSRTRNIEVLIKNNGNILQSVKDLLGSN